MGAHDYIITCKTNDQSEISKLWALQQEEDEYESGRGAYAGNSTTMWGAIRFIDARCASENEARELCLDKHEKREAPIAVSFYLPAEKTKRDGQTWDKAVATYDKLWEKAKAIIVKANDAFRARKSKMIGCSSCGSRLNKERYLANQTCAVVLRNRMGNTLNTFACPVCKAALVSETVLKRTKVYEPKLTVAKERIDDLRKPTPSKKVAWVVGGWAAS